MNQFAKFLRDEGLRSGQHVLMHSSFRKIRSCFPGISIADIIHSVMNIVTDHGSLIMPAFTYCYKRSDGQHEIFDPAGSVSKVGAVSEVFRLMPGVTRTASPTHSFSLLGAVQNEIHEDNSPESPLGKGSVLDWLNSQHDAFILLLGIDFTAMSFCHYIEVMASVSWADVSPWDYLNVEKVGLSINGEQPLKELPGCSQSFVNFENYLLEQGVIQPFQKSELPGYFITVRQLFETGIDFFRNQSEQLLCPKGTCEACDTRRHKLNL